MNKKTQKKIVEENRLKFTIPGGSPYQLRSKNALYISPSNSIRHELAKCIGGYQLRKWGDIKFNKAIIWWIKELERSVNGAMEGFPKQKADFITEACAKIRTIKEKGATEPGRRVDLVRLQDNTWFEFEVNHKIRKSKSITIYI